MAPLGQQPGHLSVSVHLSDFACFEPLEVAALESIWGRTSPGGRSQFSLFRVDPSPGCRAVVEQAPRGPSTLEGSGRVGMLGSREQICTSGFTQRAAIPENP